MKEILNRAVWDWYECKSPIYSKSSLIMGPEQQIYILVSLLTSEKVSNLHKLVSFSCRYYRY